MSDDEKIKQVEEGYGIYQDASKTLSENVRALTGSKKPSHNYHTLASLVGGQPGLAILRRFGSLNARNLLYLQAELSELEVQLHLLEKNDQSSNDADRRHFQWHASRMKATNSEQWQKVLQIRDKLREYSMGWDYQMKALANSALDDVLLQQRSLFDLPKAASADLKLLREWLHRQEYGASFLECPEDVWSDQHDDHVALSFRAEEGDPLSRWLIDQTVWSFQQYILGKPRQDDITLLNENRREYHHFDMKLRRAAEVLSIVIPSLLPTVTIIALYYIPAVPAVARLGFILAFSALFTTCLAVFTKLNRTEICAVIVALVSCQVVFIGTNNCGTTGA